MGKTKTWKITERASLHRDEPRYRPITYERLQIKASNFLFELLEQERTPVVVEIREFNRRVYGSTFGDYEEFGYEFRLTAVETKDVTIQYFNYDFVSPGFWKRLKWLITGKIN